MTGPLTVAFLVSTTVCFAQDSAPAYSYKRTFETAYMNQDNPTYGPAGKNYCGPTAATMGISWLAKHGFPDLLTKGSDPVERLRNAVKTLASPDFMDTDPDEGTTQPKFISGFLQYVEQAGYKVADIGFAGWRVPAAKTPGRLVARIPDFGLLRAALNEPNSVAFLNLGYYDRTGSNTFRRSGGHWVTVVGYGTTGNFDTDPNVLLIHNPKFGLRRTSAAAGELAGRLEQDVAKLAPIDGFIQNSRGKTIQSLTGMYSIGGPALGRGTKHDFVIVDAVIAITLEMRH